MSGDLGVAALDEEINQLLQAIEEEALAALGPPPGSPTAYAALGIIATVLKEVPACGAKGIIPLSRRPLLCVQADMQRTNQDRERQLRLRDKHLLDKWPRISCADKLQILFLATAAKGGWRPGLEFEFPNSLAGMRDLQQVLHSMRFSPTG